MYPSLTVVDSHVRLAQSALGPSGERMTPTSLVAVDLPPVIEEAVRRAVPSVGERQVAIIAEYPAHLPAVRAQSDGLVSAVEAMVRAAASWVAHGEVRVRAELASGEGLGGVPAAAVSVWVGAEQVLPQVVRQLEQVQAQPGQAVSAWPELAEVWALAEPGRVRHGLDDAGSGTVSGFHPRIHGKSFLD